jgi:hypothetical protein
MGYPKFPGRLNRLAAENAKIKKLYPIGSQSKSNLKTIKKNAIFSFQPKHKHPQG